MYCAHINQTTKKEQSVKEHLYNVSKMSMEYGGKISLGATGEFRRMKEIEINNLREIKHNH